MAVTETCSDRDEALQMALGQASVDAMLDQKLYTVTACLGKPCPGDPDGCAMCEKFYCHPDGTITHETRAN